MKYLKGCGYLALAGIMAGVCGCASTIDSLSNNTSSDTVRGVKFQAGIDSTSGNPVPSATFTMGSLARKGKGDRTVVVIDNNTTDIVSENYGVDIDYENAGASDKPRQFIKKEVRTPATNQLEEGIFIHQDSGFGMGITAGNLISASGTTIISIGKVSANAASTSVSASANEHSASSIQAMENKTLKPIAIIKADSTANVNKKIDLDGSDSEPKDKNKDKAFVYKWEIVGGNTTVTDADKQHASFTPGTAGDYVVQLTVRYNDVASDPVKQTITVK